MIFGGVVMLVGVGILPFAVGAVQNIFVGFDRVTDIWYGGRQIEMVLYQGEVIWERVTPPDDDMQTITAVNCPTARTRVRDARDGATYWVRKIGNLCFMETNLAYAGGGDNTYGDAMPAITEGTASADYTFGEARYFVPPDANRTVGTQNPSLSTDGGVTNPQYGYFYNWCAAMGRQSAACQGSSATQPNQGKNLGDGTIYNVCPAGWRLPIGGTGRNSEFQNLNALINGSSTSSDAGLRANGLYMYNGLWSNSFAGQGSIGFYWSSTVRGATYTYYPYIRSDYVNLADYTDKRGGMAVRCVAD